MYDLSVPNVAPGCCAKCRGTGEYKWGGTNNGKPRQRGRCNACRGTGRQMRSDIARNEAYNRHKIAEIMSRRR